MGLLYAYGGNTMKKREVDIELIDFAKRLTLSRMNAGYNKSEFAKLINVSKSMITEYENATHDPKTSVIKRMAKTLGVDITWLITGYTPNHVSQQARVIIHRIESMTPEEVEKLSKMIDIVR
jgi:transcriptional regulator with XRE-family HTH domain